MARTYLVGGAVRDRLLGRPSRDHDWCVVGATAEDMRAQGFLEVGNDFTVFMHPATREEHALARTDWSPQEGWLGGWRPAATIEEDLRHRDFTINAMAMDERGGLIDPVGGGADLAARVIRHVGGSFASDPVRVLRAARFAAGLPDFSVAPETLALMAELAGSGALDYLQPERCWVELRKALCEPAPQRFVALLRQVGALERVYPELDALFGVPQPAHNHPEVDTGLHTLMVLEVAAGLTTSPVVRFAALVHDLGKAATPREEWPAHRRHDQRGVPIVDAMVRRLAGPNRYRDLGMLAARWHLVVHRAGMLRASTFVRLFDGIAAFKHPERLEGLLVVCESDYRGRGGRVDHQYTQAEQVRAAYAAARSVTARQIMTEGIAPGRRVGELVYQRRAEAVRQALGRAG